MQLVSVMGSKNNFVTGFTQMFVYSIYIHTYAYMCCGLKWCVWLSGWQVANPHSYPNWNQNLLTGSSTSLGVSRDHALKRENLPFVPVDWIKRGKRQSQPNAITLPFSVSWLTLLHSPPSLIDWMNLNCEPVSPSFTKLFFQVFNSQ